MIIAIDVHYRGDIAKTVSIEFDTWLDSEPKAVNIIELPIVAEYIPGQFYKRELPCILAILKKSDLSKVEAIIVDGYVVLDDDGKKGLGGYLFEELDHRIPIIGIAKRPFATLNKKVIAVCRGKSKKTLYITASGEDLESYADKVEGMHGDFRIPTLLKILDMETNA